VLLCFDARCDTVFFVCGHKLCAGCGARQALCPTCRESTRQTPPEQLHFD
jgi:hypothetical protein